MRRQKFQAVLSGREDARKDRRHSWLGETYEIESESHDKSDGKPSCLTETGNNLVPETIDPSSTKSVYFDAVVQARQKSRFQATWGRVQQNEEIEYERILEPALERVQSQIVKKENILETFNGFLEKFDGKTAYVRLTTESGEVLYGEYPAIELKTKGVREHRRFKCWTVDTGSGVEFVIKPIPDIELDENRQQEINELVQQSFGDDDAPQNDY